MGEIKGKLGPYYQEKKTNEPSFELLQLFEQTLDTSQPENGEIPIRILGYGEISLVFEIRTPELQQYAFKRLPIFDSKEQVLSHIKAYLEYTRILQEDLHINVPSSKAFWVYANEKRTKISLYCIQAQVPTNTIGNKVIKLLPTDQLEPFLLLILEKMKNIWTINKKSPEKFQIGLDGQISNWCLPDFDPMNPSISSQTNLMYIDTSTPMYRIEGKDAMEGKLFLKSAPSFLRWVLKSLLSEVLDRYYIWRDVLIDMIANLYKEQCSEIIPNVIEIINNYFKKIQDEFPMIPITEKEVSIYYKHDKFIWVLFQSLRKFDKFLQTKIFRRKYDFYLPAKIKR